MEEEDGVVEASHVVSRVVQVLVDLAVFLLELGVLESGGRRTQDVENNEGQHCESEEHEEREKGGNGVSRRLKRDLGENALTKTMLM